jgi:hypothetical protein
MNRITAQELKPKNLVTINNTLAWPEMKGVPLMVTGIELLTEPDEYYPNSTGTVTLLDQVEKKETYNQFDEFISPIELTEEWLRKAGFWKRDKDSSVWVQAKGNYNYCIHQTGMKYPFDIRSSDQFSYYISTPQFLHTLQNAWPILTGEELTIKE